MNIIEKIKNLFRKKKTSKEKAFKIVEKYNENFEVLKFLNILVDEYFIHLNNERSSTKKLKNGNKIFYYAFNNSDLLKFSDDKFIIVDNTNYIKTIYHLTYFFKIDVNTIINNLISKINKINDKKNKEYTKQTRDNNYSYQDNLYNRHYQKYKEFRDREFNYYKEKEFERNKPNENIHPKRNIYNSLLESIKHRQEQLEKIDYSDINRTSLVNELNVVMNKAEKIKIKYNF